VAYDEDLANRIRELAANEDGLTEMKMFGGLAFLINGNMTVAASAHGGLMVRVHPESTQQAISRPHASIVVMRGRELAGWIRVAPEGVRTRRQLGSWVRRGLEFARTLPAKGASGASRDASSARRDRAR
jgi:TfoX/Sxy family transcriptional regulator of competence genes